MNEDDLVGSFDIDAVFEKASDHEKILDKIWDDLVMLREQDDDADRAEQKNVAIELNL